MIALADTRFAVSGPPGGKWLLGCHEGVTMAPVHVGNVLRLEIANTSGANWHGELQFSPFPVRANEVWNLTFAARAERPFAFSVWLGQQNPPFESLVSPQNHFGEETMTPAWQTFTHRWIATCTEDRARLNFVLGRIDNTVEIKEVQLKPEVG